MTERKSEPKRLSLFELELAMRRICFAKAKVEDPPQCGTPVEKPE